MPHGGYNHTIDFTIFKNRLKLLASANHKPMTEISKGIGASNVTLSRYLQGDRTPDLEIVARLSEYFSVSIDWLLGLTDSEDFIQLDDTTIALVKTYNLASNEDKQVIDLILDKYKGVEK